MARAQSTFNLGSFLVGFLSGGLIGAVIAFIGVLLFGAGFIAVIAR